MLFYPKKKGGLNLPNMKLYYLAAQLRGMVEWVIQNKETKWLELEKYACPQIPLEMIPFLDQKDWKKL